MKPGRRAFTLVEIMIVVVITAILAMIAIPRISGASDEARDSALKTDLRVVRTQLQIYKNEHDGSYPDKQDFAAQLTGKTHADGSFGGDLGPYLLEFPENPFNGKSDVEVKNGSANLGNGSHGWHFNMITGRFSADDSIAHSQW